MKLYEFNIGNKSTFYTDNESDVILNGKSYKSAEIWTNELGKDSLNDDATIGMKIGLEPLNSYAEFNPSVQVFVQILDENGSRQFVGQVRAVSFDAGSGSAELKCATLGDVMKGKIPNRTYSRECGFELFDGSCRVNKEKHKLVILGSKSVFDSDFQGITNPDIALKGDGYFKGGYLGFNKQFSYITAHNADKISLMFPLKGLDSSSVITLYAGCDKTLGCCKSRFDNEASYGGFPFVPSKNPMTQGY